MAEQSALGSDYRETRIPGIGRDDLMILRSEIIIAEMAQEALTETAPNKNPADPDRRSLLSGLVASLSSRRQAQSADAYPHISGGNKTPLFRCLFLC